MNDNPAVVPLHTPWQRCLLMYLATVQGRSGSLRTSTEYAKLLERFLRGIGANPFDGGDPARVAVWQVQAFASGPGPSGREPSPSTVGVRLAAVRGFYGFAIKQCRLGPRDEDGRLYNPAEAVVRPRTQPTPPKGLEPVQARQLLDAIPTTKLSGQRDRAILSISLLAGLRRSEVLGLRAGDLLSREGVPMLTFRAKGGAIRHREMPWPALLAVQAYLEARGTPLEALPADARLFPISQSGWAANVARYARKAGLGAVTPHHLRHSAAKLRRASGASIEDVQQLLGHKSLATTAGYLRRLEGDRDSGWAPAAALLGLA